MWRVCVYTIFNHVIRCILVDILWISQLWQLWTLIYNHPNHSIFFCHQKHSTQKFLQQFSSRYIYIYRIYIPFKSKQVSKHHLLHLGIPYSAKSASAAFGTCFLGLSESVQPEINRWEDVWLWIFRGFFCCTFAMFFFPDRFKRFQNINYIVISF